MESDQNRKFCLVVTFRDATRPCAVCNMMFIGLVVPAKVQFITHNENNKPCCKKPFVVVKTTISICVNRELLRIK